MVNKYELTQAIEQIAPPESAESWDLSGWIIETPKNDVNKIMLCLTITPDVVKQAKQANCDLIISHHPLFFVPLEYNCAIDMYCAHTNLDKATCGTTETLIKKLNLTPNREINHEFLRLCDTNMTFEDLIEKLKPISNNIRYSTPQKLSKIKRIAFCSGSGTEFWHDACQLDADVLITGDLKFHTALDSKITIIDIGHFESEILVLQEISRLLKDMTQIIIANETNPIKQINS